MAYRFSLDDVGYLTGSAGAAVLRTAEQTLALTDATLIHDLSVLRRAAGHRAGAVAETVRLRRRGIGKLGSVAAGWLVTGESLQQASPAPVAAHRARRLAGFRVHDLTCSIGADLVALARSCKLAVGSDIDPVRLAMAAHNLRASGQPPLLLRADAVTRSTSGLLPYADPARRTLTGRRITSEHTLPPVGELDAAHAARPPVLRLPPGIDYDRLARPGEVEIVSLDGTAREAVLWPAELALVPRRATVLRSAAQGYQLTSDEPDDVGVGPVGEWIVDPDPAVVRAHLVRHYAARHGLVQLDPHLAYLTGPLPPPGIRAFRVRDAAPFAQRTVAGWALRDGIGTLEILQRGTPVIPDELRLRLRPALNGPTAVARTLIIARIGSAATAFWCAAA